MNSEILIRPIQESDFHAYKALRLEALREHPEAFGADHDEHARDSDAVWMNRIVSSIDGNESRIFLAYADQELAGTAAVYRDNGAKVRHSAYIVGIYVRPKWRGRRLAELMIHEAIGWCTEAGVRIARLCVSVGNEAAIACYRRCGFEECGVQREVIRVGEVYHDELLMWRRVDGKR